MEAEHCVKAGYDFGFTPTNYLVSTTPIKEWKIVMKLETCSKTDLKDKAGKLVRRIPSIDDLMAMSMTREAALIQEEITAVILYTGPMVSGFQCISHSKLISVLCLFLGAFSQIQN